MNNKTITLNLDNDNRPIIDKIKKDKIDELLFSEQYKYALSILNENLQGLKELKKGSSKETCFNQETPNNIIAFAGERGTGKTSCMLSLANLLLSSDRRKDFSEYSHVAKQDFFDIGLIDPSYFDDEHNIVTLFLAKLYKQFCEESKSVSERGYSDTKNHLMKCFSNTQRHLNIMLDKDHSDKDDLSALVDLAAAVDLKEDVRELVDSYIKHFNKGESKLLLTIDDIDLNTKEAGKMAEQIRKYFVQPNIVVLLSLKIDQLETIKRLEYTSEYGPLIQHETFKKDEIETIVERYMAKLLPTSQRVYLPSPRMYLNKEVTLKSISLINLNTYPSVKQAVLELIFKKTRYLFYNSEQKISYIVPRNFRELCQLIKLLALMPDFHEKKEQGWIQNENNQSTFLRYLFETWAINNLNSSDRNKVSLNYSLT